MADADTSERHPFRFMFRFAVFVGLLYVAARLLNEKKKEFANLTESQVREKIVEKASAKVGEDKANEIADQIIPALKEKGLVKPDPEAGEEE